MNQPRIETEPLASIAPDSEWEEAHHRDHVNLTDFLEYLRDDPASIAEMLEPFASASDIAHPKDADMQREREEGRDIFRLVVASFVFKAGGDLHIQYDTRSRQAIMAQLALAEEVATTDDAHRIKVVQLFAERRAEWFEQDSLEIAKGAPLVVDGTIEHGTYEIGPASLPGPDQPSAQME